VPLLSTTNAESTMWAKCTTMQGEDRSVNGSVCSHLTVLRRFINFVLLFFIIITCVCYVSQIGRRERAEVLNSSCTVVLPCQHLIFLTVQLQGHQTIDI